MYSGTYTNTYSTGGGGRDGWTSYHDQERILHAMRMNVRYIPEDPGCGHEEKESPRDTLINYKIKLYSQTDKLKDIIAKHKANKLCNKCIIKLLKN